MNPPQPGGRKMWLTLIGLSVVGLAVTLVLAEAVLRMIGYADLNITDPLFQVSSYQGVVYEFRPEARGYLWGHTPSLINREGLRGPEVTLSKDPGIVRVGVFGDSFTYGLGVEESKTYARVLEGMLGDCLGAAGGSVQVLNFGVPSYNISNIVSSFVEKGTRYDLDVAVLSPILDDYGFDRDHRADKYGYPVKAGTPLQPGPLKNLLRKVHLAYLLRNSWFWLTGSGEAERAVLLNPKSNPDLARRTMERAGQELRRFDAVAREHGIVTIYAQLGARESPDLDRLIGQIGLQRVFIKPALAGHTTAELTVSPRDGHPSALQHRLIALTLEQAVCNSLKARGAESSTEVHPNAASPRAE